MKYISFMFMEDSKMRCKYTDANGQAAYRTVTWKLFYPNCSNTNLQCNSINGAYVPAITVCLQRLW